MNTINKKHKKQIMESFSIEGSELVEINSEKDENHSTFDRFKGLFLYSIAIVFHIITISS